MTSKKLISGDERNGAFGLSARVAHHKPGFEGPAANEEVEEGKDHRRKPSDPKDVPQGTLAHRIHRTPKGD